MKIGLFAINYGTCADPEAAVRVARHAEAAGFESVWTGEHVVLPDPAPRGFSMPATLPLLDTIAALTLVATHTSTIKVASGIIVLPLRNPVILAKELASVDVISNGRLIAGFGAGYVSAEFAAAGVPMAGRGARMEDYIRALRALWSMDRPAYQGRFVSFSGIDTRPRPHQRPAPPVVIGGEAPAALRRAVDDGGGLVRVLSRRGRDRAPGPRAAAACRGMRTAGRAWPAGAHRYPGRATGQGHRRRVRGTRR